MDLKSMLPMLMMMNGGNGGMNADMLKTISELGAKGGSGGNAAEMLPLFMQMFSKNQNQNQNQSAQAEPVSAPAGNPGFPESGASGKGAQFFSPILDFAGEKIIWHLSMMLR